MNGKYAKYIENFMESYKLTGEKLENIEIYTSENPKRKPLTYSTTKEKIKECNDKLDMQHDIVIDIQDVIKSDHRKKVGKALVIEGITLIVFAVLSKYIVSISAITSLISLVLASLSCGTLICTMVADGVWKHKFNKEIELAKFYKENRSQIEVAMNNDKNIGNVLSETAQELLAKKKTLVSKGKAQELLDIDFMDKLIDSKSKGKKDLVNLLKMYKAVMCMAQEPKFIEPCRKEMEPKKRVRIPKKQKGSEE